MHSPFTPAERMRLVGILSRLASDFDGERAAAGLLACRLLDAKGLSWADVIGGDEPVRTFPPQSPQQSFRDWRRDVSFCLRASQHLTTWEFDFLTKLQARRAAPTPKQFVILDQVLEKVRSIRGASRPSAA